MEPWNQKELFPANAFTRVEILRHTGKLVQGSTLTEKKDTTQIAVMICVMEPLLVKATKNGIERGNSMGYPTTCVDLPLPDPEACASAGWVRDELTEMIDMLPDLVAHQPTEVQRHLAFDLVLSLHSQVGRLVESLEAVAGATKTEPCACRKDDDVTLPRARFTRPARPGLGAVLQSCCESNVLLPRTTKLIAHLLRQERTEAARRVLAVHAAIEELLDDAESPHLATGA
jgi:hypothetical protein